MGLVDSDSVFKQGQWASAGTYPECKADVGKFAHSSSRPGKEDIEIEKEINKQLRNT